MELGSFRLIEGTDAPAVRAWLGMVRVYQVMEHDLDADLRRWGLSSAQFDVLAIVGANEGLSQQDLARWRMNTKGNVTRLLDRMRAEGLLETTRGFNASQIAHALAAQELSGTNVLEFLLERDDVSEVFASEEEIDALLRE